MNGILQFQAQLLLALRFEIRILVSSQRKVVSFIYICVCPCRVTSRVFHRIWYAEVALNLRTIRILDVIGQQQLTDTSRADTIGQQLTHTSRADTNALLGRTLSVNY
jgi:hypothetical protein